MQLAFRHFGARTEPAVRGNTDPGPQRLDDEAHDAAAAVGLRVVKSRRHAQSGMSGGYMAVEPTLHTPVFGTDYDKTAQEVIAFCLSVA